MALSFAVVCLLAISGSCYGGPVREIPDGFPNQNDIEVVIDAVKDRVREVQKWTLHICEYLLVFYMIYWEIGSGKL